MLHRAPSVAISLIFFTRLYRSTSLTNRHTRLTRKWQIICTMSHSPRNFSGQHFLLLLPQFFALHLLFHFREKERMALNNDIIYYKSRKLNFFLEVLLLFVATTFYLLWISPREVGKSLIGFIRHGKKDFNSRTFLRCEKSFKQKRTFVSTSFKFLWFLWRQLHQLLRGQNLMWLLTTAIFSRQEKMSRKQKFKQKSWIF